MAVPIWYIATDSFGPARGLGWIHYVAWSGLLHLAEVVSLDITLCPAVLDPPAGEDWNYNVQEDYLISLYVDLNYVMRRVGDRPDTNLLAVMREPAAEDCSAFADPRFDFMGFDLIEKPGLGISALTNCRGWPLALDNADLNRVGLLPTLTAARTAQAKLREHYAGHHHSDCHVWALWRLRRTFPALSSVSVLRATIPPVTPPTTDDQQAAIDRAIARGIDISLLRSSLKLTPTERVRRGEAFARFALAVQEAGRRARDKKRQDADRPIRDTSDPSAG